MRYRMTFRILSRSLTHLALIGSAIPACAGASSPLFAEDAEQAEAARGEAADSSCPQQNEMPSLREQQLPDGGTPRLPAGFELGAPTGSLQIELGIPEAESGLGYVASFPGDGIPIGGVGQAGLTARLAIRLRQASGRLTSAKIRVVLTNIQDATREPALNNNAELELPLECSDDGYCSPAPLRVEVSHLNRLPELEGTIVTVDVEVTNSLAPEQFGIAHSWGHLFSIN